AGWENRVARHLRARTFSLPERSYCIVGLTLAERTPGGLAHVAVGEDETLPDAAIGGNRIEHAPRAFAGRLEHHASGRPETRRLVLVARRHQRGLIRRTVQNRNTIHVSVALHHCELDAFRIDDARARVVLALERDAIGLAARRRHLVDLRLAGAVGREVEA